MKNLVDGDEDGSSSSEAPKTTSNPMGPKATTSSAVPKPAPGMSTGVWINQNNGTQHAHPTNGVEIKGPSGNGTIAFTGGASVASTSLSLVVGVVAVVVGALGYLS